MEHSENPPSCTARHFVFGALSVVLLGLEGKITLVGVVRDENVAAVSFLGCCHYMEDGQCMSPPWACACTSSYDVVSAGPAARAELLCDGLQ